MHFTLLRHLQGKYAMADQDLCLCATALCTASVATWYKALFEALLNIWDDTARQLCSMGVSDAACKALLDMAGKCAQAFAGLIQVTKQHRDKQVSVAGFLLHAYQVCTCTHVESTAAPFSTGAHAGRQVRRALC